jgi:hypothetical protein
MKQVSDQVAKTSNGLFANGHARPEIRTLQKPLSGVAERKRCPVARVR